MYHVWFVLCLCFCVFPLTSAMHAPNGKSAKYFHFHPWIHVKNLCILCIHACHDALENTWLSATFTWHVLGMSRLSCHAWILDVCVVYLVTPEWKALCMWSEIAALSVLGRHEKPNTHTHTYTHTNKHGKHVCGTLSCKFFGNILWQKWGA
jgi:hypothetical protein